MMQKNQIIAFISDKAMCYIFEIEREQQCNRIRLGDDREASCITISEHYIIIGYKHLQVLTSLRMPMLDNKRYYRQEITFSSPSLYKILSLQFSEDNTSILLIVQFTQRKAIGGDPQTIQMKVRSQYLMDKGQDIKSHPSKHNFNLNPGKIVPVMLSFLMYETMLLDSFKDPMNSYIGQFVYHKPITSISICPYKQIVMTASQDKRVKCFNLKKSNLSMKKAINWVNQLTEVPLSISIHPCCMHVAIGFKQSLRIYQIIHEGLKFSHISYPSKNCELSYSNYGHLLAASNANQILVFNSYDLNVLYSYTFHSTNANIKSLVFLHGDSLIFSSCSQGANFLVSFEDSQKIADNISSKANKSTCAVYDKKFDLLVVCYSDSMIKFYRNKGQLQFGLMNIYPHVVTCILVVNQYNSIIMGLSNGAIRVYRWPFVNLKKFTKYYIDTSVHESAVTKLKISYDLRFLISTSDDCSIYIMKLIFYSDGMHLVQPQFSKQFDYSIIYCLNKCVLTGNSNQRQRDDKIRQLKSMSHDFDLDSVQAEQNLKKNIKQKIDLQQIANRQIKLMEDKDYQKIRQEYIAKKKNLQKELQFQNKINTKHLQKMQLKTQTTLAALYQQSENLLMKTTNQQLSYLEEKKQLLEYQIQEVKKINHDYLKREKQLDDWFWSQKKNFSAHLLQQKEVNYQEEQDRIQFKQMQLNGLAYQYQQEVIKGQQNRKSISKYSNQVMRFKYRSKQLIHLTNQIELQIQMLRQQQFQNNKQIESIKKLLLQKQNIINLKEKKAKEYMKKNLHQNHHQMCLSLKMNQLEEMSKPMEDHLSQLQTKIKNVYIQLEKEYQGKKSCQLKMQQAVQTCRQRKKQLSKKLNRIYGLQRKEYLLKYDIFQTIVNNYWNCKQILNEVILKYFQQGKQDVEQNLRMINLNEMQKQFTKKRDIYLDIIDNARKQFTKKQKSYKKKFIKNTNEEIVLLSFCSSLRLQSHCLLEKKRQILAKIAMLNEQDNQEKVTYSRILIDAWPGQESSLKKIPRKSNLLPFQQYQKKQQQRITSKKKQRNSLPQNQSLGQLRLKQPQRINIQQMLLQLKTIKNQLKQKQKVVSIKQYQFSFVNTSNDNSILPPIRKTQTNANLSQVDQTNIHSAFQDNSINFSLQSQVKGKGLKKISNKKK